MEQREKPIFWIGSVRKDLRAMPKDVKDEIGYARCLAQLGKQASYAWPMRGDLSGVVEIKADDDRGDSTYRAAYAADLGEALYVLHAFQKKSKKGKATPKRDLDLIRERLNVAREHHERQKQEKQKY